MHNLSVKTLATGQGDLHGKSLTRATFHTYSKHLYLLQLRVRWPPLYCWTRHGGGQCGHLHVRLLTRGVFFIPYRSSFFAIVDIANNIHVDG